MPLQSLEEEEREQPERPSHQGPGRRLWRTTDGLRRGLLGAEGEGRDQVGADVDGERLDHGEREGDREDDVDEERYHLGDVAGEHVADEAANVLLDRAALFDCSDDSGEVVIGEHDIGCLLCDLGAAPAHRHADVGGPQGGSVIDPITGDEDDLSGAAENLHDSQLLFGVDAGNDRIGGEEAEEVAISHLIERTPIGHGEATAAKADARGHRAGHLGVVAGRS